MDFKIAQSFKASNIINIGKNKQQNSSTHSNPFSAIINGNNIFNEKIRQSMSKVSDFAMRIKNETTALFKNTSNKIKETMSNVAESMAIKPKEGSLKYYSKMSVSQLEEELTSEISNMNNNEGSNNG